MYPSPDPKKSVRALRVGDPLVLKKQEWGETKVAAQSVETRRFRHQRSAVRIPPSALFSSARPIANCAAMKRRK